MEPNSAFLLAITFPQPKQTIMLSGLEYNAQEQQVASALQQSTAKSVEAGTLPVLPTFQQYNTTGEPTAPTATEAGDKKTASRRRIDIAKQAVAYNKLKTDEERDEFLKKLPESDRQEVTEVAGRIPKRGQGAGVREGGGRKEPSEREKQRLQQQKERSEKEIKEHGRVLKPFERDELRTMGRILNPKERALRRKIAQQARTGQGGLPRREPEPEIGGGAKPPTE